MGQAATRDGPYHEALCGTGPAYGMHGGYFFPPPHWHGSCRTLW
jgi:hypothetical protein